ncbi:MAG: reverse transcriptase domain-containing protein [Thermodesulfobacteriota bacterium]
MRASVVGFSYGFRPGRKAHDALGALWEGIMGRRKVSWVLDMDIRDFFGTISHQWMLRFLEHRIADPRILRLVRKWLRAGVSEEGEWSRTEVGTPQGAVISLLLANVYLHYVLDEWVWRQTQATGDVIIVRYADDAVMGFQHRYEGERFLKELTKRMKAFGLALHPEKTRLIEFGRFAGENRSRRGEGKPETFDFLGFTHICGKIRGTGGFVVKRVTIAKRMRNKLRSVKESLMRMRHAPIVFQGRWVRSLVQGYMNYHAMRGNLQRMQQFRKEVARHWLQALRRRSQRHRITWEFFTVILDYWIPQPRVLVLCPDARFYARYPR